jgi:hypothetical protein
MSTRPSRLLAATTLVLALTACGDRRLKDLSLGINRDSVAVVMHTDSPHRSESYIMEGKFWEVLYYAEDGVPAADSIPWRELSPVVIADGGVVGWGWDYWEREGGRLKVQLAPEE